MKHHREGRLWISAVLAGMLLLFGPSARSSDSSVAKGDVAGIEGSSVASTPQAPASPGESGHPSVNENIFIDVSGDLFSVRLKDADLFDVMRVLSQKSGIRIKVDKGASKRITLSFRDMPFERGIWNLIRPMNHAMVWKRGKDKNGHDVDILEELHIFREGHQGGQTVEFTPEEKVQEPAQTRVEKRRWTDEERARMLERVRVKPSLP